ncbi:MAG: hypothetical protein WAQ27_00410 [Candidatus Microsaccharimonas sp.]
MATTKKTHTTKKNTKAKARPLTWKFYTVSVGIFVISVSVVIVIALLASHYIATQQSKERLARIQDIYKSLDLGDNYLLQTSNVFGDKRVYGSDASRTQSSEADYVHAGTVIDTVADLDAKIKAAGFTFVEEPYAGSVFKQYHYKSDNGAYVRLTVSSKVYDDAVFNAAVIDKNSTENLIAKYDTNAGPSNVVIKVNLDDNNE